ncbi:605_t:CDS:1, partial [Racocetra fulgida]
QDEDKDLFCAIHEGYQQAWDLAKVLSMVNQDDDVLDFLNISNGRLNQLDDKNDDFFDYFNDSLQSNEVSNSHAISASASTVANFNTIEIHDDDIETDLRDACFELNFLLLNTTSSNNYDLEINKDFYTGIIKAETLDVSYLVSLRKSHKCYSSQDIEQKAICRVQNFNHTSTISPNLISNLIANHMSNIKIS